MRKYKILFILTSLIVILLVTYFYFFNRTQNIYFQNLASDEKVEFTNSEYKTVSSKPSGWFTTGQEADIMLSGFGFNNAGGPLLFNHPGNIATDGEHLILADRNNNRVLIWNKLPTSSNVNPDVVLGQKDFISNNPGKELDQMNWPTGVATDGKHLLVTDVENHRVLIWN